MSTTDLYYLLNGVVVSPLVAQAVRVNGNQLNPTFTSVYVSLFTNGVGHAILELSYRDQRQLLLFEGHVQLLMSLAPLDRHPRTP